MLTRPRFPANAQSLALMSQINDLDQWLKQTLMRNPMSQMTMVSLLHYVFNHLVLTHGLELHRDVDEALSSASASSFQLLDSFEGGHVVPSATELVGNPPKAHTTASHFIYCGGCKVDSRRNPFDVTSAQRLSVTQSRSMLALIASGMAPLISP